jgi:hypothetical protein
MKFVELIGIALLVPACGTVHADLPDAGTDAPTCGGTLDNNGECVCPARFVAPECTACEPGWSGNDCSTFNDNFNRTSGALGPEYANLTVALAEDALIVNNRACGDIQAIGLLDQLIDSTSVTAQLNFDPGGAEGQEFSFIMSSDADLSSLGNVFLAGCDGGGGTCTLRIGSASSNPLVEKTLAAAIPAGMFSQANLSVDASNQITLSLTVAGTAEQVNAQLPAGFTIQRLGFIVGRQSDNVLSCIDDLSVHVN